jgi:MFS family permease
MTNSFTALKSNYHVGRATVALVTGLGASALNAIGAWVGGKLCDRHSRRAMYLLSGVLTAIVALIVAGQSLTPITFVIGVSAYNLVTGVCFAAFTATVLETIGHGDAAAATKYALCTAAGNVAITYTNLIDTQVSGHYNKSMPALWSTDAVLNLAGVAVLGLVFWRLRLFGASKHPAETVIDTHVPDEPGDLPVARIHDSGSSS